MSILTGLAILVALAIVVVLVLAALKPETFQVRRAIAIDAPPERIYPLIADFRAWDAWSPWEKKDPNLKRSFSGPETGLGARYAWVGDRNVGEGSMEIAEAQAPNRVGLKLDFLKPFKASNDVVFALQPQGRTTDVSWTMTGAVPFLAKIIHVFIDMDKMCGRDFEAGLQALKAQAERPA
jgi:uncharacterized protein YndB with AHSA1/START domain